MFKKIILWSFGILSTLALIFIMYIIIIVKAGGVNTSKNNSNEVTGVVDDLYEGGVKDLVFKLKDDSKIYYINRALENGFNLKDIKSDLLGKEVTIWYANSWSKRSYHMIQFKHQDSIYYTEW